MLGAHAPGEGVGGERVLAKIPLFLVLLALPLAAVDTKKLKPRGFVSDFAGVIEERWRAKTETYLADLERRTGAQVAVVTIRSLEGDAIEDVANRLFTDWGIGRKGKDDGALVLFAVEERRSRIENGYGLEPVLTDGATGAILRSLRPALQAGDFGAAAFSAANQIGEAISRGVAPEETGERRRESEDGIPWPLLVFGMFLLFWLLSRGGGGGGRYRRSAVPFPIILPGGGGGGWGGGGFGMGSGGFGGFGGGASGGGGASSDW
jgi:uncharacterized protein